MDSTGFHKNSVQLADTRLVIAPTTSTPIQEQQREAIGVLKDEHDTEIFAWLKLARSLERSLQPRPDHACLARNQVRAIAALRHCPSKDISAWLHLARTSSSIGNAVVSVSSPVHEWAPDQGRRVQHNPSDASIPGPIDRLSNHEPKHQDDTQGLTTQPFPTAMRSPSYPKPKYSCTLCGYVRPFKNQSDWKKHEREHDTTYICMFKGPREATPQGTQCAFCGILNPHDAHLLEHNAQACFQGPPESFSSKRRHDMVNHLSKVHGIHIKSQGEAMAVKWKYTVEKEAWSCGFCINTFVTFNERLSHINNQHFERGQTIDEWDATKVIQGLLRQPGMVRAWEEKLASLETWEIRDIIWERDTITDLQHDLEVGPNNKRSAADLAEAAYIACRMNWGMEKQGAMAVAKTKSDESLVTTEFSSNLSRTPIASAPNFGPNHNQLLSTVQGSNELRSSTPLVHDTPLVNHGYSCVSMFDLNENDDMGLPLSPFDYRQTY